VPVSVCLSASLALHGAVLVYAGPGGAAWRLELDSIRVLGEFAVAGGGEDLLLAFCVDADGAWFQAPRNAIGADTALAALGARLGEQIIPRLDNVTPRASRVLWPATLAGQPLFEFPAGRPRVSPQVTDYLARVSSAAAQRGGRD
jgi:hypothetical protein